MCGKIYLFPNHGVYKLDFIINDEVLEEIRQKADIVGLISEYVNLKKSGANYLGLCPFHNEKTPSFSVSPSKEFFHCFGCGAGGDVITFVMKVENLGFIDAVQFLADKYNVRLSQKTENRKEIEKRERAYLANREAGLFYLNNLYKSKIALNYLEKRGIDKSIAMKFGLGMTPISSRGLYEHLLKKGFKEEELLNYNLVIKSSKDSRCFDRFRNRLMFPIIDRNKNIIGFGGRVFDNSLPKYLNSKDTLVYNKGDNLYNLNNVARESNRERILLVEGYMDVISLDKSGINFSVASLGTALTQNQAKLLKRYGKQVIVCYDGDNAGVKASVRAIDVLTNEGCAPKILHLPEGLDPDEFIKKYGLTSFEAILNKAMNHIDYKLEIEKKNANLNSTEGLSAYINRALVIIASIKNPVEAEIYIDKISKEYKISVDALRMQLGALVNYKKTPKINLKKDKSFKKADGKNMAEDQILAYALNDEDIFKFIRKNMTSIDFSNPSSRIVFEKMEELYKQDDKGYNIMLDSLINQGLINEEFKKRLNAIPLPTNAFDLAKELMTNIKRWNLIKDRDYINSCIKQAEADIENFDKNQLKMLVGKLYEINKRLKSL